MAPARGASPGDDDDDEAPPDGTLELPTESLVAVAARVQDPSQKQEILRELRDRRRGLSVMLAWLGDVDRDVRVVAAESLGLMEAEVGVVTALKAALLRETDPEAVDAVTAALERLSGAREQ